MNHRLQMSPELRQALTDLARSLPNEQRRLIADHKAKIVIIDGEAYFIDMAMGGKNDNGMGSRHR